VHGGITPSNILVSNGLNTLICDFGHSQHRDRRAGAKRFSKGTTRYISIEKETGFACLETDIYALGQVICFMCGVKSEEIPYDLSSHPQRPLLTIASKMMARDRVKLSEAIQQLQFVGCVPQPA
jgi:serine/threonine protein kinase